MVNIDYVEFNITNVCNFNCTDCVTYNNFSFKGHSRWADYASTYKMWSKVLDIKRTCIVGGEPMLNPDFDQWVIHVRDLWPNSSLRILSNGSQIHRWPNLYSLLWKNNAVLRISAHGIKNREKIFTKITTLLQSPIRVEYNPTSDELTTWQNSYNSIRDSSWPDCNHPEEFATLPSSIQNECKTIHGLDGQTWLDSFQEQTWIDTNGVRVEIVISNLFFPSAIKYDKTLDGYTLHNSDPDKAIEVCCGRYVNTFVNGKLHKCSTVALLPDFIKQFDLKISEYDKNLINTYIPADHLWDMDSIQKFVDELNAGRAIEQCKFCSESEALAEPFEAGTKKVNFYARPKLHN